MGLTQFCRAQNVLKWFVFFCFFIHYHLFAFEQETFQDPSEINIDSEDFKVLPPEIQHELIKEVQAERKWMSKNNFQISKVWQSW